MQNSSSLIETFLNAIYGETPENLFRKPTHPILGESEPHQPGELTGAAPIVERVADRPGHDWPVGLSSDWLMPQHQADTGGSEPHPGGFARVRGAGPAVLGAVPAAGEAIVRWQQGA